MYVFKAKFTLPLDGGGQGGGEARRIVGVGITAQPTDFRAHLTGLCANRKNRVGWYPVRADTPSHGTCHEGSCDV